MLPHAAPCGYHPLRGAVPRANRLSAPPPSVSHETLLLGLSSIIVLGVVAQWLAWRMRVPAILLLLAFGILAGPGTELLLGRRLLDTNALLQDLVYPVVSLSVAVILFEGGLTLNLSELSSVGKVLRNLVSIGAVITWGVSALAAKWVLGFPWPLAILLGAILVVTGPTVIQPLLRHVRPIGAVGPTLKWEGIVIDPIGATLALLVFEAINVGEAQSAAAVIAFSILKTLLFGGVIGIAAAAILVLVMRRFWVADYLQNPVTLMMVVAAYALSNHLQHESGLLAVTAMGIALANQRLVPFKHILEFKESLSVLLVSALFVLLGSRLDLAQLRGLGWHAFAFVGVLIVIARPLSVLVSTAGTPLKWNERAFLMWMAPRGIVAAAVASVFALRLRSAGPGGDVLYERADQLVPVTFAVIICTVIVYGLTASWTARRLGLARASGAGFLIAGANPLARAVAAALKAEGQQVALVDTNRANVAAARMQGLEAYTNSINSEIVLEQIEGTGIQRLLALTPNEGVNSLASVHFARLFGRSQVFQLASDPKERADNREKDRQKVSQELTGRVLFGKGLTYQVLAERLEAGAVFKKTAFTKEFGYDQFRARYAEGQVLPLFLITEPGTFVVHTAGNPVEPKPGQSLISLVGPTVIKPPPAGDAGNPAVTPAALAPQ